MPAAREIIEELLQEEYGFQFRPEPEKKPKEPEVRIEMPPELPEPYRSIPIVGAKAPYPAPRKPRAAQVSP